MRVRIIGDKSRLASDIQESIAALEEASKDNTGLYFQVAINYGGRDEIVRAARLFAQDVAEGKAEPGDLTEDKLSQYLYSKDVPAPRLHRGWGGRS